VAEGGGLLNRYTAITRIVGSNPIPSATPAYWLRGGLFFAGSRLAFSHPGRCQGGASSTGAGR
jgi:hypothetical protein